MIAVSVRPDALAVRPRRILRVTQKRIDANRRNAMRSTGPRTREGKARVRLNAIRHGLRARDDLLLCAAGADAVGEIEELFLALCGGFRPLGTAQYTVVYRMALAVWKLRRAFEIGERERYWEWSSRPHERRRLLGLMDSLTVFERRASRQFERAFDTLLKMQELSAREDRRTKRSARRGCAPELSEAASGCAAAEKREKTRTNPLAGKITPVFTGNLAARPHRQPAINRQKVHVSCTKPRVSEPFPPGEPQGLVGQSSGSSSAPATFAGNGPRNVSAKKDGRFPLIFRLQEKITEGGEPARFGRTPSDNFLTDGGAA